MAALLDAYEAILIFLETGGDVLVVIGFTIFLMWMLILERVWFFQIQYRANRRNTLMQWQGRTERKSWYSQQIRQALISRNKQSLTTTLPLIQTLISICPLAGMVGALSGLFAITYLKRFAQRESELIEDRLTTD